MSADRSSGGKRPTGSKKPGGKSDWSKKPGGKSDWSKQSGSKQSGGNSDWSKKPGGKSDWSKKPGGAKQSGSKQSGGKQAGRPPREDRPSAPLAPQRTADFDEELIALARSERLLPGDVKADLEVFHPRVADLLGAAYLLVEESPDEALRYALEAKRHASRSPVVREACGMAAYYAGQFEVAIKELRTVRRLTGRDDMVPLIADCERALGHPQKAIDMASEPLRLTEDNQIELRIVAAGARMDLGQPEAAALLLRIPLLESDSTSPSAARLKYAYAEAMLASGDVANARKWFARSAAADVDGDLDAADRLEELEASR